MDPRGDRAITKATTKPGRRAVTREGHAMTSACWGSEEPDGVPCPAAKPQVHKPRLSAAG
ncbi:hypothetical protein P7K49_000091, partial [Saguinus oedipus]